MAGRKSFQKTLHHANAHLEGQFFLSFDYNCDGSELRDNLHQVGLIVHDLVKVLLPADRSWVSPLSKSLRAHYSVQLRTWRYNFGLLWKISLPL